MDKTKWYTIDYEALEKLEYENQQPSLPHEEPSESDEAQKSLTEEIPTSEKQIIPTAEIIAYLNEKTHSI